jgi:EAL domain-containing protein (putative c-di-GMP-specific phosphodiesterase class I)
MQGYFFARPMSEDEVPGFIAGMAEGEVSAG